MERRLNLGCGHDVLPGYLNVDGAGLPGVDLVHDLRQFPWPLPGSHFQEIRMINVLEHLPDTIRTMEELHRIAAPGGRLTIRVPYWNSRDAVVDPTHQRFFHQMSMDFFDPDRRLCRERPYYSTARFHVRNITYYARPLGVYWAFRSRAIKGILAALAFFLHNVIWVLEFELEAVK